MHEDKHLATSELLFEDGKKSNSEHFLLNSSFKTLSSSPLLFLPFFFTMLTFFPEQVSLALVQHKALKQ